jgi:hypothetical protein
MPPATRLAEEHVFGEIFGDLPRGLLEPIGVGRGEDAKCLAVASIAACGHGTLLRLVVLPRVPGCLARGRPSRSAIYWFPSDAPTAPDRNRSTGARPEPLKTPVAAARVSARRPGLGAYAFGVVTARATDWGLGLLVGLLFATGVMTFFAGQPGDDWVFGAHGVGGFALAGVWAGSCGGCGGGWRSRRAGGAVSNRRSSSGCGRGRERST